MTIKITADKALELLQEEVEAEGPDYVYEQPNNENGNPMCVYVHDGKPSCLVGRVLAKAGVPLTVLAEMDKAGPIEDPEVLLILKRSGVELEELARDALSTAQYRQDARSNWGHALAGAREAAI